MLGVGGKLFTEKVIGTRKIVIRQHTLHRYTKLYTLKQKTPSPPHLLRKMISRV